MIRNYLTIALRSIFRNKLTAFINIAGLALAMSSALLIYLFVVDELSYDSYHLNADRTFRVTRNFLNPEGASTLHLAAVSPPFGPLLKNDFGDFLIRRADIQRGVTVYMEFVPEVAHRERPYCAKFALLL